MFIHEYGTANTGYRVAVRGRAVQMRMQQAVSLGGK